MEVLNFFALGIGYIVLIALAFFVVMIIVVGIQDVLEEIQYRAFLKKRKKKKENKNVVNSN